MVDIILKPNDCDQEIYHKIREEASKQNITVISFQRNVLCNVFKISPHQSTKNQNTLLYRALQEASTAQNIPAKSVIRNCFRDYFGMSIRQDISPIKNTANRNPLRRFEKRFQVLSFLVTVDAATVQDIEEKLGTRVKDTLLNNSHYFESIRIPYDRKTWWQTTKQGRQDYFDIVGEVKTVIELKLEAKKLALRELWELGIDEEKKSEPKKVTVEQKQLREHEKLEKNRLREEKIRLREERIRLREEQKRIRNERTNQKIIDRIRRSEYIEMQNRLREQERLAQDAKIQETRKLDIEKAAKKQLREEKRLERIRLRENKKLEKIKQKQLKENEKVERIRLREEKIKLREEQKQLREHEKLEKIRLRENKRLEKIRQKQLREEQVRLEQKQLREEKRLERIKLRANEKFEKIRQKQLSEEKKLEKIRLEQLKEEKVKVSRKRRSPIQQAALTALAKYNKLRNSEISLLIGTSQMSTSNTLSYSQRSGFVTKTIDGKRYWHITDMGRQELQNMEQMYGCIPIAEIEIPEATSTIVAADFKKDRELRIGKRGIEKYFIPDFNNPIDVEIVKRVEALGCGRHAGIQERHCKIILRKRLSIYACPYYSGVEELIEKKLLERCQKKGKTRNDYVRELFCVHFNIKEGLKNASSI